MFSNNLICDLLEYIDNNLYKEITINELSNKFFFNKYYIMKKFKKEIGISIISYINSMRIYNSLNLFTNNSILRISIMSGYNYEEYFSEMFKNIIGISPKKYYSYLKNKNTISITDENKLINKIINLNYLKNKYLSYKRNKKIIYNKKLSLFKS